MARPDEEAPRSPDIEGPQTDPMVASVDLSDLATVLDATLAIDPNDDVAHARRLTIVATVCCEAFRRHGLRAVLVGGGVIEFQLPGAYTTPDIDLVISRNNLAPPRSLLDHVFAQLALRPAGARHWVRGPVFVEVPDWDVAGPVEYFAVGPYQLPVIAIEIVLVGRIVEYEQTGHTGHAAQAILMLRLLRTQLDEGRLRSLIRQERVEEAYAVLDGFAMAPPELRITDAMLREARDRMRDQRRRTRAVRQDTAS